MTAVVLAAVVSFALQPLVLKFLQSRQVLDVPNDRSSHDAPMPRGGGLGVIGGATLGLIGFVVLKDWQFSVAGWIVCCTLLGFALVGWMDDVHGLGVRSRLTAQLVLGSLAVVAVIIAANSVALTSAPWQLGVIGLTSLVWVVGYTNAFNFMDGVNGISALNGAFAAGVIACLAVLDGVTPVALIGGVIAAACLGFLPWNVPNARLFLGDVGSYGLGSALAVITVWAVLSGLAVLTCLAPFVVYLADTCITLARRVAGRRPWNRGHREHVYQRLADNGIPHVVAAAMTAGFAAAMVAATLAPLPLALPVMALLAFAYLCSPALIRSPSGRTANRFVQIGSR